jgi:uncharacterized protein YjbI with pentapeptide repeats
MLWVTACLVLSLMSALASEAAECPGKSRVGWQPTKDELRALLTAHKTWLVSRRTDGCRAQLEGADLRNADLSHAALMTANMSGAHLLGANLSGASLNFADLSRAWLHSADLSGARLDVANLSGAILENADLSGARLSSANLSAANLNGANLAHASVHHANLSNARFEALSVDDIRGAELARGLTTLRFDASPTGLVLLRDNLRKRGAHAQASELTYAIRSQLRAHAWKAWATSIEAAFNYGGFEVTCGYGLYPGRPLRILGALIPVFGLVYVAALVYPSHRGGIWRIWAPDRILKHQGQSEPEQLSAALDSLPGKPLPRPTYRTPRVVALGFYMSVLSAFHIGWRELNVGTWIARLQPREYTLRATGWVRFVSGLQSLISVYMIALWVLTYFGRPFD